MIALPQLEEAIKQLPPAQLNRFRRWFTKFDAAAWDRAFEDDVRSGRLAAAAKKRLKDKSTAKEL